MNCAKVNCRPYTIFRFTLISLALVTLCSTVAESATPRIDVLMSNTLVFVITPQSRGTGTVIASNATTSWILTAAHLLAVTDAITIATNNADTDALYYAHVVKLDRARDLALLTIQRGGLPTFCLGSYTYRDELIGLMSYSRDKYEVNKQRRIYSSLNHQINTDNYGGRFIHDATIEDGFSGGPIFDMNSGLLVGVIKGFSKASGSEHVAVDISSIRNFLAQSAKVDTDMPVIPFIANERRVAHLGTITVAEIDYGSGTPNDSQSMLGPGESAAQAAIETILQPEKIKVTSIKMPLSARDLDEALHESSKICDVDTADSAAMLVLHGRTKSTQGAVKGQTAYTSAIQFRLGACVPAHGSSVSEFKTFSASRLFTYSVTEDDIAREAVLTKTQSSLLTDKEAHDGAYVELLLNWSRSLSRALQYDLYSMSYGNNSALRNLINYGIYAGDGQNMPEVRLAQVDEGGDVQLLSAYHDSVEEQHNMVDDDAIDYDLKVDDPVSVFAVNGKQLSASLSQRDIDKLVSATADRIEIDTNRGRFHYSSRNMCQIMDSL